MIRKHSLLIGLTVCVTAIGIWPGCTPYEIRRVAVVPPLQGTPSSGRVRGTGHVRVAAEAFPLASFFETKDTMKLGDPGMSVHTSMFGGSVRVGVNEHVNIGFRYQAGDPGLRRDTHKDVAPAVDARSHGYGMELETSYRFSGIGYFGTYLAMGLQHIPYAIYTDKDGDGVFKKDNEDVEIVGWWHLALMTGVDWGVVAIFGGLNIQTGYTNEGYGVTNGINEAAKIMVFGRDNDTIETVIQPPVFFLGVEVEPTPFLSIGLQAWIHTGSNDTAYNAPGIGTWIAFHPTAF